MVYKTAVSIQYLFIAVVYLLQLFAIRQREADYYIHMYFGTIINSHNCIASSFFKSRIVGKRIRITIHYWEHWSVQEKCHIVCYGSESVKFESHRKKTDPWRNAFSLYGLSVRKCVVPISSISAHCYICRLLEMIKLAGINYN